MKNPLVDALRQANSDEEKVVVKEPQVDVTETLPETDEVVPAESLELIDSPAEDSAESTKSINASLDPQPGAAEDLDEMTKSTGSSLHPAIEAFEESTGLTREFFDLEEKEAAGLNIEPAAAAEVFDRAPLAATAVLTARGVSLESRTPILPKIGRLAPILCLFGMATAAGGYLLIDRLSSGSLNEDLDDMSERVSLGETDELGTGAMTVLPVTDISVVRQTAEKNAASTALQREDARAPDQSRTTSVTSSNTSESGRSGGTRAVPIGVSRHSVSAIDDEAYQFVVTAFDAYGRQDYDIAENMYLQALDIEPNHADALAGLGAVYQRTGRTDLAAANYQRLLGVDPGNTLAASALISLRSAEVDWDTESELKYLLQRFPLAHHLHFALASHFVEQGRWADARYEFREAQELAPDNADYNFNLAVSLERLGDFAGARRYYESAILHAGGSANVDKQAIAQHLAKMTAPERERL